MGDKWYIGDGLEDDWYIGDAPANRRLNSDDYAAAAKLISDWGCEGEQSAARIIGKSAAQGMTQAHIRKNVQESFPGINVDGKETTEELQDKIKKYRRSKIESELTDEQLKQVHEARKTLRKYKLSNE